jgi:uncharacterized protein
VLQHVHGRLPPQAGQWKIEHLASLTAAAPRSVLNTMTIITLLLGLVGGVLVGLLGIGGGVVLVPAMVYLLRMDQHTAQGTSLFVLLPPIGLGALREYWKQGQVDWKAGILCAVGILLGAYAGSFIALLISSRNLKGLFGCFLMFASLLLWKKTQSESDPSHSVEGAAGG